MSTPSRLMCYGLAVVSILTAGCGSGGVYNQTSLFFKPAPLTQIIGQPVQLHLQASYSDGNSSEVTSLATWVSTTPTIASVDKRGVLACIANGTTDITAALAASSTTTSVTCSPFRLSLSPVSGSLLVSHSLQLTATALYPDGSTSDKSLSSSWSTSPTTIGTITKAGLVTCGSTGTLQVTAIAQGVTAVSSLLCARGSLTILGLSPVAIVGQPLSLSVIPTPGSVNLINAPQSPLWSTASSLIATVTNQGVLTCVADGTTELYAASSDAEGAAAIQCVVPQITISSPAGTLLVNQPTQLAATASLGSNIRFDVTASATWTTPSPLLIHLGAHGDATCKSGGSALVLANSNGGQGSKLITCSGSTLAIEGASSTQFINQPVQLQAVNTLPDGTITDVTNNAAWSSAATSIATISSRGLLNCVAVGSAQVMAQSNGVQGTASVSCAAAQLVIRGIPAFLPVAHTAILSAEEDGPNGAKTDVSRRTIWSTQTASIATIAHDGTATCGGSGTTTVTAQADGATAIGTLNCSSAPASITIVPSPLRIRVGEPTQMNAIAQFADGQRIDVSSAVTWQSTPSQISITATGLLFCNAAGLFTATATYFGVGQDAQVTCTPPSLNTPSYYSEASDEFVGPFPSWTNVKTAFGAVGDGQADDTAALQKALDSLNTPGASPVLWLPAGTYNITGLVLTHKYSFSIIGESPETTTLKWVGEPHGTMLQTDGSTDYRITRLTFDGSGIADTAESLNSITSGGYYQGFNELSDQHIVGVSYGLRLPKAAETTVERIYFDHISQIAFSAEDWNTLNIFVNDSLFVGCGTGLSNTLGAGAFTVSNSYFRGSLVADMSIRNTGYYTARHNTSLGSKAFFVAQGVGGNPAQITLQNNTILDPLGSPFYIGNMGPLMLIDNVVRTQNSSLPYLLSDWDPTALQDLFTFGNTYTANSGALADNGLPFPGRTDSYDDSVTQISRISDVVVPTAVYTPPNLHRQIFEVSAFTGDAIQQALDQAVGSGSQSPVVHLRNGTYHIRETILLPSESSVQLIGDDSNTTILMWEGVKGGTILQIPTSNVSVKYLGFFSTSTDNAADGILLTLQDQPGMQVIVDQAQLQGGNSYSVNFDGSEHLTAELFSAYTMGSITGVNVLAGPFRAAREGTLGTTNQYTGSLQSEGTGTSFNIDHYGKFMVQDNWHDAGATSPRNFVLTGSGTLTEQSGLVGMNSNIPFEIDGFDGDVALIGLEFSGGFKLSSGAGKTNLFNLGLLSDSPAQPSGQGNITVNNLLSSYYNQRGIHIAHQDDPDTQWLRHMLSQSRTESPVQRLPLQLGAHRIRLSRIEARNTLSALHIKPDRAPSNLYYTIGAETILLSNEGNTCRVSSSADPAAMGSQWVLAPAGDGDYEIVLAGSSSGLTSTMSPDGTSTGVNLAAIDGSYRQRWLVQNRGDGRFDIRNRDTGQVLKSETSGACSLGPADDPKYRGWSITAH